MTERQFIAMILAAIEECQERIRDRFSLRKRCGILRPAMVAPLAISLPRLRTHLETTLGSGGPKLRAVTTNGGITIRQR